MCGSKGVLKKNGAYWGKVRKIWADYISNQNSISLKNKIDEKLLHEYLIPLGNDYVAQKVTDADIDEKIKGEINRFIGHEDKATATAH